MEEYLKTFMFRDGKESSKGAVSKNLREMVKELMGTKSGGSSKDSMSFDRINASHI